MIQIFEKRYQWPHVSAIGKIDGQGENRKHRLYRIQQLLLLNAGRNNSPMSCGFGRTELLGQKARTIVLQIRGRCAVFYLRSWPGIKICRDWYHLGMRVFGMWQREWKPLAAAQSCLIFINRSRSVPRKLQKATRMN